MAAKRCFTGEPTLATLMADPISIVIRQADRLTEAEVWRAIKVARAGLFVPN